MTVYYVTVTDGSLKPDGSPRVGYVVGPLSDYAAAAACVDRAKEIAEKQDPWSHFYLWGVAKTGSAHRTGVLNSHFQKELNPEATS